MARGPRKIIYYMGSVILAMLLFLAMFIMDEDKSWEVTPDASSSTPIPESSESSISSDEISSEENWEVSVDESAENSSSVDIPPIETEDSSSSEDTNESSSGDNSADSSGGSSEGGASDSNGGGGGEDSSGGGGGDSTSEGEDGGGGGPDYLFRIKTDENYYGTIYLRENALAKYVGYGEHGFKEADWAYEIMDGEINPLVYFAKTLELNGYDSYTATIELNKIQGEYLPYYPSETLGSTGIKEYEIVYYPYDFLANGLDGLQPFTVNADYAEMEEFYIEYVEENYLQICKDEDDDEEKKFAEELKAFLIDYAINNGVNPNADIHTLALQVQSCIQNAAYYTYRWAEKDYPTSVDMVSYFLDKEANVGGVCRHFAAAATMMFRALGIPARYTKGFAIPINGQDVWTEWYGAGHAWTEIYIQGYGWIPLEVTGGTMMPDDETQKPEIEDGDYPYMQQETANPFDERNYFYQKIRRKEAGV